MNVTEILSALESQDDTLPRQALNEAMARPAEVTEPLLDLVREVVNDPESVLDPENNSIGYLLALYLLAQFREPRAYPLIIAAVSQPAVDMDKLLGDALVEDLARILASVSCGDLSGITSLIENPALDRRVRSSALDSLFCLVYCDVCEREPVVKTLRSFFHGKLEREPSEVWTTLIRTVSYLGPEELYAEVKKTYEDGLLVGDKLEFLMEDVDANRVYGFEMGSPQIADTATHFLIENTLEEIGWTAMFSAESRLGPEDFDDCRV